MMRIMSLLKFLSNIHGYNLKPSFYKRYMEQQREAMLREMEQEDDEAMVIDLRSEISEPTTDMTIDLTSDDEDGFE